MSRKGIIGFLLLGLVVGLAVGYSISIAVPFQTTAPKPTISLSSNSVKAGALYTATLTGFPANTEIYGWTVNQQVSVCFTAGTTDANGKLVVSANAPQTVGTLPLVACNKAETIWAATSLTVT
ncbi:MAG TPA: hypothetical protein VLV84_04000 [Candidatus Acidoferrales bacterium]|nr:hypothetical protein [Candidatus Acidoferrales bacterium]